MKIKFTNLYKLIIDKSIIFKKINTLIKNSKFVGGYEVLNFEKNFKSFVKAKYCVAVGNGTDALEMAVSSLNLKKGSEIIVPVNTWISTAEAVINSGYKVKFCDINLSDYSINIDDLKKQISKKTKAVIAVHLYGIPSDVIKIKKILHKKKIKLIEDCAQAHGSKIASKHVGTFGDLGTFSFFPGKNLGGIGDGGAVVTNSKKLYENIMRMRNHGALGKYDHKFSGRNSRLDTINAAVLDIKLKKYNHVIKTRNKIAKIYFKGLSKINEVSLFKLNKKNTCSFHQFVIRTKKRNQLMSFLTKNNIETMVHYPYMLNELKFFKNNLKLKNSNNLGNQILSLPISEEHTLEEIDFIVEKINFYFKKKITNKDF